MMKENCDLQPPKKLKFGLLHVTSSVSTLTLIRLGLTHVVITRLETV